MKLFLKSDYNKMLQAIVTEKLNALNVSYSFSNTNEITITDALADVDLNDISAVLKPYGISIKSNESLDLVYRIKATIDNFLESNDVLRYNTSDYLAEKLNYSYKHLSTSFTEATHASIESYVILRKVDIVKDLLINSQLTLTEIAFKLNYSSVAHLSRQFKKTTGLTPSAFQRIMSHRKKLS
ncbi:helix-turn-helix domain-containing protein [Winogradskyella litorisediminis]|uniref:Helix-turn-helix domain-containing protein n=1 Tax=Winogradskyella litorisediminis TaxID=1156618 RepID=A0ABW3N6V0_9FLAO